MKTSKGIKSFMNAHKVAFLFACVVCFFNGPLQARCLALKLRDKNVNRVVKRLSHKTDTVFEYCYLGPMINATPEEEDSWKYHLVWGYYEGKIHSFVVMPTRVIRNKPIEAFNVPLLPDSIDAYVSDTLKYNPDRRTNYFVDISFSGFEEINMYIAKDGEIIRKWVFVSTYELFTTKHAYDSFAFKLMSDFTYIGLSGGLEHFLMWRNVAQLVLYERKPPVYIDVK